MRCAECIRLAEPSLRRRTRGPFAIHGKAETPAVPGWIVVAPLRHVEQLDALTPDELATLGPLLAEVGMHLRAVTSCSKLYVSVYGELLAHFHVHVIARPETLAADLRGPAIFAAPPHHDLAECTRVLDAVLARL